MPEYKLTYFPAKARAEVIRLEFHLRGIEFADTRITGADWGPLKEKTTWKCLPILEHGKVTMGQSGAIMRYLADTFGLMGKTPIDRMAIEQVVCAAEDLHPLNIKWLFAKDDEKDACKEKFLERAKAVFGGFDEIIKQYGKDNFAVGSEVTLADLVILDAVDMAKGVVDKDGGFLKHHEPMRKVYEHVKTLGKLPDYLKERDAEQK